VLAQQLTELPQSPAREHQRERGEHCAPLINFERGEVIGINTLQMRGVQGIGFALPIEAAYRELTELRSDL